MDTRPLAALDNIDGYRRLFADSAFWTPYAQEVCRRHALSPRAPVRIGVPGTCPAPIVADRWVIKFFGRLFDGGASFAAEQEAARLVKGSGIRVPEVYASGLLDPEGDWPWPYIVFEFIPARSLGEQIESVSYDDLVRIAREMGDVDRKLHSISLEGSDVFPNTTSAYRALLERQRAACAANHREWGTLPSHLVEQIDAFLPAVDELIDSTRPAHLIHADLTRDHLLGQVRNGAWQTLALIDFGDAMTGDLLYELAALHLDLFHGDTRLLAEFLDAYGLPAEARAGLPRRAMSTSLLHQFDVLTCLPAETLSAPTLDDLARRIWLTD